MIEDCEKIVKKAQKLGAEQSEAFMMQGEATVFMIEKNSISYTGGTGIRGIGIRVLKNNKIGFAYCTEIAKADDAINRALSISKLSRKTKYFSFPEPKKVEPVKGIYDKKIVNLSPEEGLEISMSIIEQTLEVDKTINLVEASFGYGKSSFAVVNSEGVAVEDIGTSLGGVADTVLKNGSTSTGTDYLYSRSYTREIDSIGKNAAQLAVNGKNPIKIESGEMSVVFTPYALLDMFEFITIPALYGDAVHKGESVYTNKIGELVASKEISLIEDATLPGGLNSAKTDDEGTPSQKIELIKSGILKNYLYDMNSALEYGKKPTGNGIRGERTGIERSFKAPPSISARNFIIEGKPKSFDSLISEVENGILVYSVLGAHTANPASGDFSVNSSTLFKIEHGEIKHSANPVMLSGNFPQILKNFAGMANDYKKLVGHLTAISVNVPSIRFNGIKVNA